MSVINIPTEEPEFEFAIDGGDKGTIKDTILNLMKMINNAVASHKDNYLHFLAMEFKDHYNLDDCSEFAAELIAAHVQDVYEEQKKSTDQSLT